MVTKRTFPRETTAPSQLSHVTITINSRCPSMTWTCWSTWEAPATALAAAEAAGMPVRRPSRPAAVSAADAAGAGPELGCAGQLEQAAEAPIDEASSLCVGLSVDRSVDRSGLVGICIWCTRGWLPSRGFDPPAGCFRIGVSGCGWVVLSLWNRRVLVCCLFSRARAAAIRSALCAVFGRRGSGAF